MSIFDENIVSEHPMSLAFRFVREFIDMYFNNIITCADWKVKEAQNVIDSQFRKKIVFFEQFGISPPHILITHYSVNSWKVIVSTNYIDKDGIIVLYNDIISKDYEGAWDRVKAKQKK